MKVPVPKAAVLVACPQQVFSTLDNEVVILHLKDGQYYGLNATGSTVWNAVQKPCTVEELKRLLLETYDVEAEKCEQDLLQLLAELIEEGLIEVQAPGAK